MSIGEPSKRDWGRSFFFKKSVYKIGHLQPLLSCLSWQPFQERVESERRHKAAFVETVRGPVLLRNLLTGSRNQVDQACSDPVQDCSRLF